MTCPARDQSLGLGDLLATEAVHPVYQPIVGLDDERTVGYEALARGPRGSTLESPAALFSAARAVDRVVDLCWLCRRASLAGALEAGLRPPLTLFVNVEPEALEPELPDSALEVIERASGELRVILEITERALAARPGEMLRGVDRFRELGWGVALDDVGADRHSLALMPFLRPDVIKLDLRLVQARPSVEMAEVVNAVNAEAERTGAAVLAEGIENEGHKATAVAMGATLGQGWAFGRPGPLAAPPEEETAGVEIARRGRRRGSTPMDVVQEPKRLRRATKGHLLSVSRHLEEQARGLGETAVVLSGFQSQRHFSSVVRRRYQSLAERAAFVGVFGVEMGEQPAPGVRGAVLERDDPLVHEWDVAIVSPHFGALLTARDLGDTGPDHERRFEFVVTYDRDVVIEGASTLMARVAPHLPRDAAPQG